MWAASQQEERERKEASLPIYKKTSEEGKMYSGSMNPSIRACMMKEGGES